MATRLSAVPKFKAGTKRYFFQASRVADFKKALEKVAGVTVEEASGGKEAYATVTSDDGSLAEVYDGDYLIVYPSGKLDAWTAEEYADRYE